MAVMQVRKSNKGFPLLILTAACGGRIVPQKRGHCVSTALWTDHFWSSGAENDSKHPHGPCLQLCCGAEEKRLETSFHFRPYLQTPNSESWLDCGPLVEIDQDLSPPVTKSLTKKEELNFYWEESTMFCFHEDICTAAAGRRQSSALSTIPYIYRMQKANSKIQTLN